MISAAAAKRRSAASPLEIEPFSLAFDAVPSRAPAERAAPAAPSALRNQRLSTVSADGAVPASARGCLESEARPDCSMFFIMLLLGRKLPSAGASQNAQIQRLVPPADSQTRAPARLFGKKRFRDR
jgi:hypothetical protein